MNNNTIRICPCQDPNLSPNQASYRVIKRFQTQAVRGPTTQSKITYLLSTQSCTQKGPYTVANPNTVLGLF